MSNYWIDRLKRQEQLFNLTYDETQKVLVEYYTNAIKEIEHDILTLYAYLLENSEKGVILPSDVYKYNRYFDMIQQINERIMELGYKEVKVLNKEQYIMWDRAIEDLKKYDGGVFRHIVANPIAAKQVIDGIWCADGKHWKERVFQHKGQLQEALQKGLMDCVSKGADVDALSHTIKDIGQKSWHDAQRIARTELCHIQIQSNLQMFKDAGFEYYKYMAIDDGKTCHGAPDKCEEISMGGVNHDGIYSILEAQTGVNLPPIHPNCRCSIIPIMKGVNDNV